MSELQNDLSILQNTICDLADAINEVSVANGNGQVVSKCTSFKEYPNILRAVSGINSGGIVSVFAYKISDINPGTPKDNGSFNFETGDYIAPDNWKKASDLNAEDKDTVWMTQAIFKKGDLSTSNGIIIDSWSNPIRISNLSTSISDKSTDTVYLATKDDVVPRKPMGTDNSALNDESKKEGWSETYVGITENNPFVWISTRSKVSGKWSQYSTPVLYARYGKDGEGAAGLLSRTVFAFKATTSRNEIPSKPVGGKWNANSNDVILPDGWYEAPNTDGKNIYSWMSTAIFTSDNPVNPEWTNPVCITGEDGVDGTDGLTSEFIYALLVDKNDFELFKSRLIENDIYLEISQTDTVPNFILDGHAVGTYMNIYREDNSSFKVQLTDSPLGIDDINKVEIYWTRSKNSTGWSAWSGPMYWSVWGENGMDGDGIEYIFSASQDYTCDAVLPVYADLSDEEKKRFQEREYVPEGWFDNESDWGGLGPDVPYLFCSSRKQYVDENTGKQMWGDFSTPKIWGYWGKDGMGSYTSFAFCVSKKDLSKYTVTGGNYENALYGLTTLDELKRDVSDSIKWSDTVPSDPAFDETIWMINKFFQNTEGESEREWFGPMKMADSAYFQVEFNCPDENDTNSIYDPSKTLLSLEDFKLIKASENPPVIFKTHDELEVSWREYVKANGYGTWNDGRSGAVYMATARFVNNTWEPWSVNKIKGESGNTTQFIFKVTDGSTPSNPSPAVLEDEYQKDTYLPEGWSFDPQSVAEDTPICWVSQRTKSLDTWNLYSDPSIWSMYAKGNVHLELSEDYVNVPCEPDGRVDVDYKRNIAVKLLLYDNGFLVNDVEYYALINDDTDDYAITKTLTSIPDNPDVCGFYGNTLYIGSNFLNRYKNDAKLRVECRAKYKDIPYTKAFTINKSTNTYELSLSHNVLYLNHDLTFKDYEIRVQVIKWIEDQFKTLGKGHVEWIVSFNDDREDIIEWSDLDADTTENIILKSDWTNVKSIQINYRYDSDGDILTSEIIGTVIDGMDGKDAISQFVSFVFTRSTIDLNSDIYTPEGGNYSNPIPDVSAGIQWYDSIPYGTDPIWMSQRTFYSDHEHDNTNWSIPVPMADTADFDVAWSIEEECPELDPLGDNQDGNGWIGKSNDPRAINAIWMATRNKSRTGWSSWTKSKIKGEKGDNAFAQFQSFVFCRSNAVDAMQAMQPVGGTFDNPFPDTTKVPIPELDANKNVYNGSEKWTDAPEYDANNSELIWMTQRVFFENGMHDKLDAEGNTYTKWSHPTLLKDSNAFDVDWSSVSPKDNPGNPSTHPHNWGDSNEAFANWMAVRTKTLNQWGDWVVYKIRGEDGKDGIGVFTSNVFMRNNGAPVDTPTGGTYNDPYPNDNSWSDSVPAASFNGQTCINPVIWMSSRVFYSDDRLTSWSTPTLMKDSETLDIWWCMDEVSDPGNPTVPLNNAKWSDMDGNEESYIVDAVWMAIRTRRTSEDGSWSKWAVSRIKGEKGKDGVDAVAKFRSQVFCRSNLDLSTQVLSGGSFDNPVPETTFADYSDKDKTKPFANKWTDGIPPYDKSNPAQIWTADRWFYSDNSQDNPLDAHLNDWSYPTILQDTESVDIWWCDDIPDVNGIGTPTNPGRRKDNGDLVNWYDGDDATGNNITTDPVWMAIRRFRDRVWSDWVVSRVKGEKGDKGEDGIAKYKAQIFCRTNTRIDYETYAPSGGTFEDPMENLQYATIPNDEYGIADRWSDGVPAYNQDKPRLIWMSYKVFDQLNQQESRWSTPVLIQDTDTMEIWWCDDDSESVSTVGTPDAPGNKKGSSLKVNWYDGDELTPGDYVRDPIWMAVQRIHNGERTKWQVSRIKGEKGDPGKDGADGSDGADGVNGGFGPMARYGQWKSGTQYYSRDDDRDWYDIVTYNEKYYLCKTATNSVVPGTNTMYWVEAENFEFIAADVISAEDIISERIQVDKLVSYNDGSDGGVATQINIHDGQINIRGSVNNVINTYPSIKIGLDSDGNAILQFLDKGVVLYDLGPKGLRDLRKTIETQTTWNPANYNVVSSAYASSTNLTTVVNGLRNYMNNSGLVTSKTLYKYSHYTIENGVETAEQYNGYYANSDSTSDWFTGYVLAYPPANANASDAIFNPNKEDITEELQSKIIAFNNKYGWSVDYSGSSAIYTNAIYQITGGKEVESVELYFN